MPNTFMKRSIAPAGSDFFDISKRGDRFEREPPRISIEWRICFSICHPKRQQLCYPARAGEESYSAASMRRLRLPPASPRASTGFKNCPV